MQLSNETHNFKLIKYKLSFLIHVNKKIGQVKEKHEVTV